MARAEEAIGREELEPGLKKGQGNLGWLARAYAGLAAVAIVILMAGFGWYLAQQKSG
ncbi:MAG: hypothetical protein H5U07_08785 [Candidatus Aminicenantes bacterium]|nr:hypothetical protein [Candidatus Aminicenantes bacterium]